MKIGDLAIYNNPRSKYHNSIVTITYWPNWPFRGTPMRWKVSEKSLEKIYSI